jgi:hypothetical protein
MTSLYMTQKQRAKHGIDISCRPVFQPTQRCMCCGQRKSISEYEVKGTHISNRCKECAK